MPVTTVPTLATTFSEVLANLAFMFTTEEALDGPASATRVEARITYDGPVRGRLIVRCTPEFARLLAANLLGQDESEEVSPNTWHDALKELMNVVCGQFVTTVYGVEPVFQLGIPKVREVEDSGAVPPAPETTVQLYVEGFPVELTHEVVGQSGPA